MATKPWKKNAWSFRADVMCNASAMAFNPGLYPPPPPRVSPPRRKAPLIFQRLEDTKEEHALRCHVDACQKYLQSKEKVKRQCGKSDQELLMENCHLYRTRLENAEFLERARGVEDCHSGEQVWAMSLREHWTVEPRIGDLYSTPVCYQKEGSQKEIEQIGSPYKENLHHLISDSSSPRNTKQLSTLTLYKRFLKKCEKKFAKVKVHAPKFPALEVVGTRLSANFVTKADEAPESCNSGSTKKMEVLDCDWEEAKHGPRAELSTTNLFLHGKPGEHVRSSATLCNTGSTCLYYQWHRQPPISLLVEQNRSSKCMAQAGDDHLGRASFFYIVPTAGCLVPGESKDFYVEFHPSFPGSFMETWILHFSPKLLTSLQALHLHGAAAVPKDENSIRQRELLQRNLDVRQRTRGLNEVFCEILEKAIMQVHISFKKAPDFVVSDESFNFMRRNVECFEDTPLYYNPSMLVQFQDLAAEIHTKSQANMEVDSSISEAGGCQAMHTWDWSVSNLIGSLDNIPSNEDWTEMIRQRVSCLRLIAAVPPHPTALFYTAMYKALTKLASDVEEVMEERNSENESGTSNSFEIESNSNIESGFARNMARASSQQASANASVSSGKTLGSGSAKQAFTNASMRQAESFKRSSFSKQNTASVKAGGIAENPSSGIAEQARAGEMEGNATCEERVRSLLQEGVVEQFLNNAETAFAKLVPTVQKRIKCCMAEGDEISASWLSLWFIRFSHAFAYY